MKMPILSFLGAVIVFLGTLYAVPSSLTASAQSQTFTISGLVTHPPAGTGVGIAA